MKPTWRYSFLLFHSHNPPNQKKKFNYRIASSRAKTRSTRSHTCMKYGIIIIFIWRNSNVIKGDLKILHKKCQNKVDFPDVIFNVSKMVCVMPSTLCMTGDLWPRWFIWHQDIHIVPCGKFPRIGGAPPETFSSVKYDAPEEVGGDRKSFDSSIRKWGLI